MENQTVKVSFRFLKLNRMQAYTLKKEIRGAQFYQVDDQDSFVGLVPLEEPLFDELNDFFIRQQIGFDECDILVQAIIENKDMSIENQEASIERQDASIESNSTEITVPHVVNKMLKYIDCQLTYAISGS